MTMTLLLDTMDHSRLRHHPAAKARQQRRRRRRLCTTLVVLFAACLLVVFHSSTKTTTTTATAYSIASPSTTPSSLLASTSRTTALLHHHAWESRKRIRTSHVTLHFSRSDIRDESSTVSSSGSFSSHDNNDSSSPSSLSSPSLFFIRPAMLADMGRASEILTDGFFSRPTSLFSVPMYWKEKLITFLCMESTCATIIRSSPLQSSTSTIRGNYLVPSFPDSSPSIQNPMKRQLFVACHQTTGVVLGLVEVDARSADQVSKIDRSSSEMPGREGPYMCNLAVDQKFQQRGIATALVKECERQVEEWYRQDKQRWEQEQEQQQRLDDDGSKGTLKESDDSTILIASSPLFGIISNSLCLKVRQSNVAAVRLYENMGYQSMWQEDEPKTGETLLLMRKQLLGRTSKKKKKRRELW